MALPPEAPPRAGVAVDLAVDLAEPLSLKQMSKRKTVEVERDAILKALVESNWNKKKAAQALNISYRALQYKIKEYGIDQS